MDGRCCDFYASEVLPRELDGATVLLADNFDCHISEEGQRVVADTAFSVVYPLPPNNTFTCQPLDVGVMGPPKSALRITRVHNKGPSPKTAAEKRRDIMERTIITWNSIDEGTVLESFETAIPRQFDALEFM
ncbi:hypothetical protein JG688_00001665 [Phytophthora aleatoria]|uniref:DDE-1 domain-containing protein n=1 Tax=Phytophthora aleatoria TaxID=2496075 RepID=A0A8J5MI37_9STRA|nr:hypothetical protein JG688_00001665 [Phytophthora aleatoria]